MSQTMIHIPGLDPIDHPVWFQTFIALVKICCHFSRSVIKIWKNIRPFSIKINVSLVTDTIYTGIVYNCTLFILTGDIGLVTWSIHIQQNVIHIFFTLYSFHFPPIEMWMRPKVTENWISKQLNWTICQFGVKVVHLNSSQAWNMYLIDDIYSISSESNFDKIAFIDQSMYSQDNNPQKMLLFTLL